MSLDTDASAVGERTCERDCFVESHCGSRRLLLLPSLLSKCIDQDLVECVPELLVVKELALARELDHCATKPGRLRAGLRARGQRDSRQQNSKMGLQRTVHGQVVPDRAR